MGVVDGVEGGVVLRQVAVVGGAVDDLDPPVDTKVVSKSRENLTHFS